MDDIAKMTEQAEYLFLKRVINGLRDKSITIPEAKECAKLFLNTEPFTTIDEAKAKINQFVTDHTKFDSIKKYIDAFHHEQGIDNVIEKMRQYIKDDNVDEALKIASVKE